LELIIKISQKKSFKPVINEENEKHRRHMKYEEKTIWLTETDLRVSYIESGNDVEPVIIFIHGFPFNKSMWLKQMEALSNNYHVVAYDIRGHGNSDAGSEEFSIELFVNDLVALMDALKIDKAILCGLSMGGYIALNANFSFPERINALVLSDTQCLADTPELRDKRMQAIEAIRRDGVEKYASDSISNLFAPVSIASKIIEIAEVSKMITSTTEHSLTNTLLALSRRKETCSKLAGIKVPVLVMVGNEDKITPPEASRLIHEKINGSFFNVINNAGHLSSIENPEEFNGYLKKFVAFVKY
jgi:3-oxoadipate enol-lactonase